MSFSGGIAASFLVRREYFRKFAMQKISSAISLGCIAIAIAAYPSAYEIVPLCLLSMAFALVACGNDMFGVLAMPVSRFLGEMSYSIYLLHGIILYVTFNFIVGVPESRALSAMEHWLLVAGITPVLIVVCFVAFRFIESPAMRSITKFTAGLR
jgi:peptidoglycan/LPS O-acetylase OafA/YrhL